MAGRKGRPKKPLDYEAIQRLAEICCTQEEIAYISGVSVDTLQRDEEFNRVYQKGLSTAKTSLRRKQWEMALAGNVTMLVWLGKQYLGQSEKVETNDDTRVVSALDKVAVALGKNEKRT